MLKIIRVVIVVLLALVALFPFLITPALKSITPHAGIPSSLDETKQKLDRSDANQLRRQDQQLKQQQREHHGPDPRRYFATTKSNEKPSYYLESTEDLYSNIPSRAWDESSLSPLDYSLPGAETLVKETMQRRLNALLESDALPAEELPKYLPPQFPQWDRSIHERITSSSTILGMPPECCPSNDVHQHLTKNFSKDNVLSEKELSDCTCRSPRNYAQDNRPIATLVTAFYQMSSKHPVKMYQKTSGQLLSTSDPMIIFCEPNSTWVDFFIEKRKHAPTIVVPLPAKELRLVKHFPQESFWKAQYDIDPEAPTHHKNVNTMLYVIWDEKLVLLHTVGMLNPFNTTQFVWVDTGYWRNPGENTCWGFRHMIECTVITDIYPVRPIFFNSAPHMYRNSAVRINITEKGVNDEATLLFQMRPYNFNKDIVISGDEVLVGGNCFAGTYNGVSNLYSAFYETFWAMASTGQFVGSDQKVLYRTCHTYPNACHIHAPRQMKQWLKMLGELLPDIGKEKIGKPLKLKEFVSPNKELPVPPLGIVDNATSTDIWKEVKKVDDS